MCHLSNGQETLDPTPKVSMVSYLTAAQSYMGFFYENKKFETLINETVNKP